MGWNFDSYLRLHGINRKWAYYENYFVFSCNTNCPCPCNIYNTLFQQNGPTPKGKNSFSQSYNRCTPCVREMKTVWTMMSTAPADAGLPKAKNTASGNKILWLLLQFWRFIVGGRMFDLNTSTLDIFNAVEQNLEENIKCWGTKTLWTFKSLVSFPSLKRLAKIFLE